jgi:hypothetical protein
MKSVLVYLLVACAVIAVPGVGTTAQAAPWIEVRQTSVTRDAFNIIHLRGTIENGDKYVITHLSIYFKGLNSRHEIVDQGIDIPISVVRFNPGEKVDYDVSLRDSDGNEIVNYSDPLLDVAWIKK